MKHIYLLPSLLTTGNLFCGTYAIIQTLNGNPVVASWSILMAIFFDFLDGQVARLKNSSTKFGLEYDSLADLISFGVAPAIIVYLLLMKGMGRIGFALVFIYLVCVALRLARFNSQKPTTKKLDFIGLPSPAAGGFIASSVILITKHSYSMWKISVFIIMLTLSFLMISSFRYPSLKVLNLWKKRPFLNLVAVILCGTMMFLHLELFLFICFFGYVSIGIFKHKQIQEIVIQNPEVEEVNEAV